MSLRCCGAEWRKRSLSRWKLEKDCPPRTHQQKFPFNCASCLHSGLEFVRIIQGFETSLSNTKAGSEFRKPEQHSVLSQIPWNKPRLKPHSLVGREEVLLNEEGIHGRERERDRQTERERERERERKKRKKEWEEVQCLEVRLSSGDCLVLFG